MELNWQAWCEWLLKMNQCSPEEAVARADRKLEKQTGKGLTYKEQDAFLREYYRNNPYKARRERY